MICEELKRLRLKRGLTAAELAQKLTISASTVYAAEHGFYTERVLSLYNRFFEDELSSVMLACEICGKEFVSENGFQLRCPACTVSVPKYPNKLVNRNTHSGRKLKNPNPLTALTVQIVCMYHIEGRSVKFIANELMRSRETIRRILYLAKKNGTYERYRQLHLNGHGDWFRCYEAFRFILSRI